MKEKKKIILSILGILLLVLVTIGVTFAVFTYTKLGTTENTVTTGTLKFLYTENTGVGAGINIENAFPVTDAVGKSYDTDKYVFDFSVEATNSGTEEIPYEVTLRKKSNSSVAEKNVKVYLTDMTDDADTEIVEPTLYSDLIQTTIDVGEEVEKTIYNGMVLGGELTYLKDFRLRMWIDESSNQDDINGKTFVALVNVYSNVPLVSQEELDLRNSTEISNISNENNNVATASEEENYDYIMNVPEGTDTVTLDIEPLNSNATVEIEKIDSLTYMESTVKKLSISKTFSLIDGDNYFKITITSENKKNTDEYILNVKIVKQGELLTDAIFKKYPTIYENATLSKTAKDAGENGLFKSTVTNNSKPTYFFRGSITNNYVSFAGQVWRILRINEDGTIRMVMQNGINNNATYIYNTNYSNYQYSYYSYGSNAKTELEKWYTTNIVNKGYDGKVAKGDYFCEQLKVRSSASGFNGGSAAPVVESSYNSSFKCATDGNGYGKVSASIGLLNYDDLIHAGAHSSAANTSNWYIYTGVMSWTMSPNGYAQGSSSVFNVGKTGKIGSTRIYVSSSYTKYALRPVINLNADVRVEGNGTSGSHWIVI